MERDLAVVFDCGSTNLTVVVVDAAGTLVASSSTPNAPVVPPGQPEDHLVWDTEQLWDRLGTASGYCMEQISTERLCAVTITTWGADGAPVAANGDILYPPISWQDGRTAALARQIEAEIDPREIYEISGYQVIPFNTLLKLRWLRENEPEVLDSAKYWLMMPGLLSMFLCGEVSLDPTAAGTMMAMDMSKRQFSSRLLEWAGVEASLFPAMVEPGGIIGRVSTEAAERTGLPEGLPVVAAGHDTQFAAVGSGATSGEVILSSGTWEILMLRSATYRVTQQDFADGLLTELDAEAGTYNPQLLMMGSGVIEWLRDQFFTDVAGQEMSYDEMVVAAAAIPPGSDGITLIPSFVADTGPLRRYETEGTILGLKLATTRDHLYRAALEGLSYQLRQAVEILTRAADQPCQGIRAVGGGSKNELWNQIRADVCQLAVTTIEQKEATVLGAAMFAFVGGGVFDSVGTAQEQMVGQTQVFEPSTNAEIYRELFAAYAAVPEMLAGFYKPA